MLLLIVACQEPFDEGRHDLTSFRIVAMGAAPVADASAAPDRQIEVRAVVYSGYGLHFDRLPDYTWTIDGRPAGESPRAYAGSPPFQAALTVSDGTHTESAVLDVLDLPTPPLLASFTRGVTDLDIEDAALPPTERGSHEPGADTPIAKGGGVRLGVDVLDDGERTTHWMATGGQFAEIDASTTDWFAGTAVFDDTEVESTTLAAPDLYHALALTVDGNANLWTWLDVAVDVPGPWLKVGGRLFPVDSALRGNGRYTFGTRIDTSSAGVELTDLAIAPEGWVSADDCAVVDGTYAFERVAAGECLPTDAPAGSFSVDGEIVE